jgi:hypothetical protein
MRTGSSGTGRSSFSVFGVGFGGCLAGSSFESREAARRLRVDDFRAGVSLGFFLVGDGFLVRDFVMGSASFRTL